MGGYRVFIPETELQEIVAKYRAGMTIPQLQAFYGHPYHVLKHRLNDHRFNIEDKKSTDLGQIQKAEKALIQGSFPNYHLSMNIKTQADQNKYESLLIFYAKADLNRGHVNIDDNLLEK
jgi:hypothetical protein